MPEKKNKSAVKSISLLSRKNPKDAGGHLDYSITKKIIHHDDYESLIKKQGYAHRRAAFAPDTAGDVEAASTLLGGVDDLRQGVEAAKERPRRTHVLPVRRDTVVHSPHVVRLLDEWEQSARTPVRPKKAASLKNAAQPEGEPWIKEVARLRSQASGAYKSAVQNITIDLLGKKSKSRHRKQLPPLTPARFGSRFATLLRTAGIGIIRWLFEFVLSIPLGFLLAFAVLLSLVETGSNGATKAAKAAASGASWTVAHVFFAIIALAKAVFVIPIKLATLLIAAVYRAISSLGTFLVVAIAAAYEAVKNYASVFSRPPKHLYRKLAAIACVAIVVMLPVKFLETAPSQISILKGSVLGATREGYSDIASLDLASAQANFTQARESLDSLNAGMRAMVEVLPAGQDGLHAISAGESLSRAGAYISAGLAAPEGVEGGAHPSPITALKSLSDSLRLSLPHLTAAQASLESINPDSVPPEFRDKFAAAATSLPRVNAAVFDTIALSKTLLTLLGGEGPKRYAVLFQNNNELRPAGGFIGSLAFVDIEDGKVVNIEVPGGGPYDFQGYLSEHVKAPKPLSLINARWELQDANWYPDWPTSAAKVAWFLEHAGYSSVDGVIAVQATTLEKLLAVTGPIEFPEYQVTLSSENVLKEIQRQVELEYDLEENKPKAYIGELLPAVMEKLLAQNSGDLVATLGLIKSEIREKNILLHFRDEDANKAFAQRGWQPSIVAASTDYLSIIHANIGGGKTDGVISESREQEITISSDGSVTAELTIIRQHTGDPQDVFEGVNNVDYVRVYVPEGSELVSFEGTKAPAANLFETPQVYFRDDEELAEIEGRVIIDEATGTRITSEFGKTVFGNWLQVSPGNVSVAKIKYKLPFTIKPYDVFNPNIKNGYSLIAQKQPGARNIPYSVSLRYPSDWLVGWNKAVGSGEASVLGPGLTVFEGILNEDAAFAVSFEKQ